MAAIKERGDRNQQTRAAAMMSDAASAEPEESAEPGDSAEQQSATKQQQRQPAPPSMMTLGAKRQALKLADSAFIGIFLLHFFFIE